MDKLRVDYFLGLGLELAAGDVIETVNGGKKKVSHATVSPWNEKDSCDNCRFVDSLVWRETKAQADVPEGIPHMLKYCGSTLVRHKPDVEELVKMQQEHDKKMAIVDAVNYYNADLSDYEQDKHFTHVFKASKDGYYRSSKPHWRDAVCSIEEFTKCVEELSEAAWMNDGNPMFYDVYKRAWHDMQEAEKAKAEQKWRNGDECFVDNVKHIFVAKHPQNPLVAIVVDKFGEPLDFYLSELSKPETAEQKAKRERDEKAKALFELLNKCFGFNNDDWDSACEDSKENYRKMIDAGVKLPD